MEKHNILFHFKRDLRLEDNAGLYQALKRAQQLTAQGLPTCVLPIFIFDSEILSKLMDKDDRRLNFIHHQVEKLKSQLMELGSDLLVLKGSAFEEIEKWLTQNSAQKAVDYFGNYDDDPYPISRDQKIKNLIESRGGSYQQFKDHLIFSRSEILNQSNKPYTVFTPYKKVWFAKLQDPFYLKPYPVEKYFDFLIKNKQAKSKLFSLADLGFEKSDISQYLQPRMKSDLLKNYAVNRDFPSQAGTSLLGVHLRFGTISPRKVVLETMQQSETFASEIAWRDFFAQILYHYPHVVKKSFKPQYDRIAWRDKGPEFEAWCEGQTGYPIVDAGMRELKNTGFMHNRVRMITASFLAKHLLVNWWHGERWFSRYLMDYDLASNNGNWQWAAGTGADAAPYFRVFNPTLQAEKFDPTGEYVKKWVPELLTAKYPAPIVEHKFARERAIAEFKKGIGQ